MSSAVFRKKEPSSRTKTLKASTKHYREILKEISQTRSFFYLPRVDLYILKEFMIPFSILIFTFVLLFLIADVFNDLGDFLDAKSPLMIGVRYFLLKIPGNVRFILPLTVLLSCMYTIANFGRHRELTAMRASGISLFRCGRSIYFVAFLVMLVNYWFNEKIIPDCTREADYLITSVCKGAAYKDNLNTKLQYHSSDKLRSWFFGKFVEQGEQRDVKVKFFLQDDSDRSQQRKMPERVLEAKTAEYIPDTGWEFHNYTITEFIEGLPSTITRQKEGDPPYLLTAEQAPEHPGLILKTIILPETLPTLEIYHLLRENKQMAPSLRNVYATLFYYRLAFPWVCFLCSFLALPLAAKNERSGIFTAIVTALVVVVVYQVLTEIFMIAGRNSYIPPFIAGTFPTLAFVFYGWFFLIRKAG